MKIVYLHQYFNTPDMPGATRSYELARRLVAMGHIVHMITSDRSRDVDSRNNWTITVEAGITVHWAGVPYSNRMSFSARLRSFFAFAMRAAARARTLGADVIFATSTPLTIAIPALYASKRSRAPMVFEVRDLWPDVPIALGVLKNPLAKWAARALEETAYRNSAHVVALAPGMKAEINAKGYPASRITVIPNGCDVELFLDAGPAAARLRKNHDWLQDRPLVVYAGALGRINAVDYLVDIAAHVRNAEPDIRFVVVGTGIEAESIERRARETGVLNQVLFMIGEVPKTTAAAWISAADITIALVRGPRFIWKDATQNKYFDSLAAGTPVASNYDGWQAQVAQAAGAGVILDNDDAGRAAQRLASLLMDKDWLADASRAATALAQGEYSRDRHARDLERVLQSVIEG